MDSGMDSSEEADIEEEADTGEVETEEESEYGNEEMTDFEWSDLVGTTVLGGREGVVHISM